MDEKIINSAVDNAFSSLSDKYDSSVGPYLYPGIANDPEYLWLRIKESININNNLLKEALKDSLSELLSD